MSGATRVVMNTVGPFFRFGVPILTAAIDAGTDYIDVCDDWEPTLEMLALLLSLVVGLFGIVMAYSRYRTQENWVTRMAAPFKPLEPWLQNAYYVDEFYMRFIVNPLRRAATWMADVFDKKIIDGLVNGIGSVTMDLGGWTRSLQNGRIPTYALSLFIGVVAVVIYFIFIG